MAVNRREIIEYIEMSAKRERDYILCEERNLMAHPDADSVRRFKNTQLYHNGAHHALFNLLTELQYANPDLLSFDELMTAV